MGRVKHRLWVSRITFVDRYTYYADGNRWQTVSVTLLTAMTGGTLGLSDETIDVGFFSLEEMVQLDLIDPHRERVQDFLVGQEAAFVR